MTNLFQNLFKIQIGIEKFNPEISVIGDLESCWRIYWNFINSVQNIESDVWFECVDLHSFSNIDLTQGGNYAHMTDESWICVKKNRSYMIDRVKSLKDDIVNQYNKNRPTRQPREFCDNNCNDCPMVNHPNSRVLTKVLNDIYDKFGKDVYEIVETQCPNFTCCYDCCIDDFCHLPDCKIVKQKEEE